MKDLSARIRDLTERIDGVKGELADAATGRNVFGVTDPADVFFDSREERERRLHELERELSDLQGGGSSASTDLTLDFPSISVPDQGVPAGDASMTATFRIDDISRVTADPPTGGGGALSATERPRTQERPGTGAKEPKPEKPPKEGERASGQITDKTGEYGPVRHSDPSPRPPRVEDPDVPGSGITGRSSDPGPAGGQITGEDGAYGEWKTPPPKAAAAPKGETRKAPAPTPAPASGRPRTQEKPGTGTKAPRPEDPRGARSGPTGQITDETGEYGPEQTWQPGDRDWNKVNRAGGTPKKVVLGAAVLAAAMIAIGALALRPITPPAATTASAAAPAASTTPAATAAATAPGGAPAAAGPAQSAASLGYRCVGDQMKLFDSSNTSLVSNGGTPPTFSTNGKPYCLVSVSTYHWNGGRGATPGQIGLIGGAGNVGPVQTQSGTGVPNADWVYVPAADARPLLLGEYRCTDSDPATWSKNDASGGQGFCRVWVQTAVK